MSRKISLAILFLIGSLLGNINHIFANDNSYPSESLLESGDWYKIKIDTTGIYKLTYSQLKDIGLDNPEHVRLYGYGGEQLSFMNDSSFPSDVIENPIFMNKGDDGVFNDGDYILFYSMGSYTWNYNESDDFFLHQIHTYSNYIYILLTDSFGEGLRIASNNTNDQANNYTNETDKYVCYHEENYNLIQSGRFWYTEKISSGNEEEFSFQFNNRLTNEPVNMRVFSAYKKTANTPDMYINLYENDQLLSSTKGSYSESTYQYAYKITSNTSFIPSNNSFRIKYEVTGGDGSSESILGYICLNTRESINFTNGQYSFRDKESLGDGNVTQFTINSSNEDINVWDVTDPTCPSSITISQSGTNSTFNAETSLLKEFMAFDGSLFLSPIIDGDDLGKIENQNLHATANYDMLIVTHPDFLDEANTLAEHRRTHSDPLSVYIVTPEQIYNEFSSGTPDASAIRNFVRLLYEKSNSSIKYLLLLGDGSYDNKTLSEANTNKLPTYQNTESTSKTGSFVTDDFFGILEIGEGQNVGTIDVGVGRFPVQTNEEAQIIVDKIKNYESMNSAGSWRSNICFIADDEDSSAYLDDSEELANDYVEKYNPEYNIDKIYLDAYKQISTPSGETYPDVTTAINNAVKKGALIIDYIGHGNPRILAHEEVLTTSDVRKWTNYDKLAIFITASCEVGRFDDYDRTSLGEWLLLNPDGGGVASFTTTRVVYANPNQELNRSFFNYVFNDTLRLGDIITLAKNNTSGETNKRNFSLLGDPSLKLAIPKNEIVITGINNNDTDTLSALSTATIEGYLINENGDLLDTDGILYTTIYDKPQELTTLENDTYSYERTFNLQNNSLFNGTASITAGFFSFEIIIPKDINYDFGNGKISLYAVLDDNEEGMGYSSNIIIGGIGTEDLVDNVGPEIEMYINDTTFVDGGICNENPVLLAKLNDMYGINTSGIGIGHNITATIDDNEDEILILNDFYQGEINQYNGGEIEYPLNNIEPGYHTIRLKVWDIMNNSSEAEIGFYVYEEESPTIENVYNAPNPFDNGTWFNFEHNQADTDIDINIKIYDTMGQLLTILNNSENSGSFNISPIFWDGTTSGGQKLDLGMYIYNVEISTADGRKTTKSSKLMIFR